MEQHLKEQQLKERQLKEQQLKEQRLKEQQLKEQQLKEQQLKEQQLKEQRLKEKQLKEQQLKEQQLQEQRLKEQQLKVQQLKEQQLKEQQLKEQQLKEQQLKVQQLKEQNLKERQLKEQQLKERQLKEQQLKEQQLKEQQMKEQQQKERQLEEQPLKERQLKEQQPKDQILRSKHRYVSEFGKEIKSISSYKLQADFFGDHNATKQPITTQCSNLPSTGLTRSSQIYVPTYQRWNIKPTTTSLLAKHFAGLPSKTLKNSENESKPPGSVSLPPANVSNDKTLMNSSSHSSNLNKNYSQHNKNTWIARPPTKQSPEITIQYEGLKKHEDISAEFNKPPQSPRVIASVKVETVILPSDSSDSDTPPPTPPLSPSHFSFRVPTDNTKEAFKESKETYKLGVVSVVPHRTTVQKNVPQKIVLKSPTRPSGFVGHTVGSLSTIAEVPKTLTTSHSVKLLVRRPSVPPPPPPADTFPLPPADTFADTNPFKHMIQYPESDYSFPPPPPPLSTANTDEKMPSPTSPVSPQSPPPLPLLPPPSLLDCSFEFMENP